jgi:hypothetical protein
MPEIDAKKISGAVLADVDHPFKTPISTRTGLSRYNPHNPGINRFILPL